jgi:hypothetical protein
VSKALRDLPQNNVIIAKGASTKYWLRGVNTYVNETFLYLIFNRLDKNSKNMFSLCQYRVLCVDGGEQNILWHKTCNKSRGLNTFWRHCSSSLGHSQCVKTFDKVLFQWWNIHLIILYCKYQCKGSCNVDLLILDIPPLPYSSSPSMVRDSRFSSAPLWIMATDPVGRTVCYRPRFGSNSTLKWNIEWERWACGFNILSERWRNWIKLYYSSQRWQLLGYNTIYPFASFVHPLFYPSH